MSKQQVPFIPPSDLVLSPPKLFIDYNKSQVCETAIIKVVLLEAIKISLYYDQSYVFVKD